ncbi:sulfotransferase [Bizionia arctica]|uniref:Sulfotransferase family protein n=1 Tax=Bizionia arctica TaxID=1495645 RepID=A0A917LRD0_9FLAO|nr:sulfotransferase [Bizionia arctica]GGG52999.1 hypothetical protein GCM10010976_25090 [Bizionia arctica]
MSAINNNKVFVLGLPKSGTSTLATMLRVLGFSVTGPNPYIEDIIALNNTFERYEAFQDYPWCFEYPSLLKNKEVKVILLKRNKESWVKSFKESYGGENKKYLSYKYMKLSKQESDAVFYDYHDKYYDDALNFLVTNQIPFIEMSLEHLNWKSICDFLGKTIPKNMFGMTSKIPKVNSENHKKKGTLTKYAKPLKKQLHSLLGKNYFKLTSFIYKNK